MTTELPAVISRRIDPRAGVSVVWGIVRAGAAHNVIPDRGRVAGTVRILDAVAWAECEPIIREAILEIVRPYGVTAFVDYQRGVPPVVNDPASNAGSPPRSTTRSACTARSPCRRAWAGRTTAGTSSTSRARWPASAPARPAGPTYDLHQGNLVVDERAIGIGARVLADVAVRALGIAGR